MIGLILDGTSRKKIPTPECLLPKAGIV